MAASSPLAHSRGDRYGRQAGYSPCQFSTPDLPVVTSVTTLQFPMAMIHRESGDQEIPGLKACCPTWRRSLPSGRTSINGPGCPVYAIHAPFGDQRGAYTFVVPGTTLSVPVARSWITS